MTPEPHGSGIWRGEHSDDDGTRDGPCRSLISRRWSGATIWPCIVAIGIALLAAVIAGVGLLFDGSWFFLNVVSSGEVVVPQNRLTFAVLTWPTALATEHLQSLDALLVIYTIPLVIMPLAVMGASWWIARRHAPRLIVWPALGVLLIDLPGQMHWIATSIRTNQLLWPVLIAVLCGMPYAALPIAVVFTFLAVNLHPQAAVYLWVLALVAGIVAWRTPETRRRLVPAACIFGFLGVYRYSLIQGQYAAHESSLSNQLAQWKSAVWGWPLALIVATFIIAALFAFVPSRIYSNARGRRLLSILPVCLIVAVMPFMLRWGADATQWRTVIDYRGPSLWNTIPIMLCALIDTLRHGIGRKVLPAGANMPRFNVVNAAGILFALVIVTQCVSFWGQRQQLESAVRNGSSACIPSSSIQDFADNPLNFWTLPAASLMVQSKQPTRQVLPDPSCKTAWTTGEPVYATIPEPAPDLKFMDMSRLRAGLIAERPCHLTVSAAWFRSTSTGGTAALLEPGSSIEIAIETADPGSVRVQVATVGSGSRSVAVRVGNGESTTLSPVDGTPDTIAGTFHVVEGATEARFENVGEDPVMLLDPVVESVDQGFTCPR